MSLRKLRLTRIDNRACCKFVAGQLLLAGEPEVLRLSKSGAAV